MTKPIWLASYPKSGNTWFRLLVANLIADSPLNINELRANGGIASGRSWFDTVLLFPSGLLSHDEVDRLRPAVYRAGRPDADLLWDEADRAAREATPLIKTHDAWTLTAAGEPLLGGAQAAAGAILIVRDPRDVAVSFASHRGSTIDRTIAFMGAADSAMCGETDRQSNQLRQRLLGWSGFNRSWLDQRDIPTWLVRYEDLHADTAGVLAGALAFAGIEASRDRIDRAVRFAAFRDLQAQEEAHGFREAPPRRGTRFFRRGRTGGWRDELTVDQARQIERDHGALMLELGYREPADAASDVARA